MTPRAARIDELELALAARPRRISADAEQQTGGLQSRIAELERAADDDLARRAARAGGGHGRGRRHAARRGRPEHDSPRLTLDAAAALLRARVAPPDAAEAVEVPRTVPVGAYPPSTPVVALAPSPVEAVPVAAPPAPVPPSRAVERAAAAAPIVTEARHPTRADVTGESRRAYPWLRGALVKLAHDDPASAVEAARSSASCPSSTRSFRHARRVRPDAPRVRDVRDQRRRRRPRARSGSPAPVRGASRRST